LLFGRVRLRRRFTIGDRGAAYKWSERLAKELELRGEQYAFYSYPGNDHLLNKEDMQLAAARDAAFFNALMDADSG
jgi:hypothetical protein